MRSLTACAALLALASCRRNPPPANNPQPTVTSADNGLRWNRIPARPWLGPRVRDVSLPDFRDGYQTFVARLAQAIEKAAPDSAATPEGRRDSALRRAWADALGDFTSWMDELGVRPGGRGISQEVSAFLDAELRTSAAIAAAPVVLGVFLRDPGGEPHGLIGRLVDQPPQDSRAVRKFALETIGLTNRAEYLPLLARIAAEPGPFAALAVRAAGLMDGGIAVLRAAIQADPSHRHAADVVNALTRSPDHAAAADLLRDLARRGDAASLGITLRVMKYRGALPDLKAAVRAAASNLALPEAARADARAVMSELRPASIAAIDNPAGSRPGKQPHKETGGR